MDKSRMTYEVYKNERHGYQFTHVVVRVLYENNTQEKLDGTVGNKDGYGSVVAAQGRARVFQQLLDGGHGVYYDMLTSGLQIHLEWQHYQTDDYCDPTYVHLGRTLEQIKASIHLLNRLGKAIERRRARLHHPAYHLSVSNQSFTRPEELLGALCRMKETVQVEQVPDEAMWVPLVVKIDPLTDEETAA